MATLGRPVNAKKWENNEWVKLIATNAYTHAKGFYYICKDGNVYSIDIHNKKYIAYLKEKEKKRKEKAQEKVYRQLNARAERQKKAMEKIEKIANKSGLKINF